MQCSVACFFSRHHNAGTSPMATNEDPFPGVPGSTEPVFQHTYVPAAPGTVQGNERDMFVEEAGLTQRMEY